MLCAQFVIELPTSVVSVLALESKGRWFDPPLLQSFGWDSRPRSCLHDLHVHVAVSGTLNLKTTTANVSISKYLHTPIIVLDDPILDDKVHTYIHGRHSFTRRYA